MLDFKQNEPYLLVFGLRKKQWKDNH